MSKYTIRPWRKEDRAALKEIWRAGFGDSDEVIEGFHDIFLKPETCFVGEADGRPVSAMYILPDITLRPFRQNVLSAGYTYALATLPEYRGRGIGAAVYRACCDKILESADAACVIPAEPGLFPLYESANGAKPLAYLREAEFQRSELEGFEKVNAARVPINMYMWMREGILSGLPHASMSEDCFDLLEENSTEFFTIGSGAGAAVDTIDGVCYVRELLDPGREVMDSIATLARWCPAEKYVVRTPVFFRGPGKIRPYALGVLKTQPSYPMPDDFWWGFGLE